MSAMKERDRVHWWKNVQQRSILTTYVLIQSPNRLEGLAEYLRVTHGGWCDRTLAGRIALTAMRTGTSELRVDKDRYIQLERSLRLCQLCGVEVEDPAHFLLRCTHFADRRTRYFQVLDQLKYSSDGSGEASYESDAVRMDADTGVTHWSELEQLQLLLGSPPTRIRDPQLRIRLCRSIMVTVAEWMDVRNRWLTQLEQMLEPL